MITDNEIRFAFLMFLIAYVLLAGVVVLLAYNIRKMADEVAALKRDAVRRRS